MQADAGGMHQSRLRKLQTTASPELHNSEFTTFSLYITSRPEIGITWQLFLTVVLIQQLEHA